MLECALRTMLKFVKKKNPSQQQVEISRPSNLIVSKHKLVRTEGDFILIMEEDKVIGVIDKRDLDLAVIPAVPAPVLPSSSLSPSSSSTTTSPQSHSNFYLTPTNAAKSTGDLDTQIPSSPVGTSPNKYKTLPAGFSAKDASVRDSSVPLFQWQVSHDTSGSKLAIDNSNGSNYKTTSVEQLFSPPIPTSSGMMTSSGRNRAESMLQPQGSHKYDTITFAPSMQMPVSSSAQCNVEIRLGEERAPPPPPNRAPPAPLSTSPCHCAIFIPEARLEFTAVQSVSVEDPDLKKLSLEEMRRQAEDFENFIQEQVQEKWTLEKEQTERWIEKIAGKVAKTETMNTIRSEFDRKRRPSLANAFRTSLAPSDPEPNGESDYEKLYTSGEKVEVENRPMLRRQATNESDGGDFHDMRF